MNGKSKGKKYKKCSPKAVGGCGKSKKIEMFSKDKRSPDGHCRLCKKCTKEYKKGYYQRNKEAVKKKVKQYKTENPEKVKGQKAANYQKNKEHVDERNKQWAIDNKEAHDAYHQAYRDEHKEQTREYDKDYREKNREKIRTRSRIWARIRRAMVLLVNEHYSSEDEKITLKAFSHKCVNCKSTENIEIDHHRPLIKGNALTIYNAVPLCRNCNASKNDRNPEDFYGAKKCAKIDRKLQRLKDRYHL